MRDETMVQMGHCSPPFQRLNVPTPAMPVGPGRAFQPGWGQDRRRAQRARGFILIGPIIGRKNSGWRSAQARRACATTKIEPVTQIMSSGCAQSSASSKALSRSSWALAAQSGFRRALAPPGLRVGRTRVSALGGNHSSGALPRRGLVMWRLPPLDRKMPDSLRCGVDPEEDFQHPRDVLVG